MRRLQPGKVPIDVLQELVLSRTGADSDDVLTPPKPGLDFAVLRVGREYLVVSSDPITGASERIGEYAIQVSANDVATSGNRPQFAEVVAMLPSGSGEAEVGKLAEQVHRTAKKLGIAIVGGHTEVTPGLRSPIVVTTMFSRVRRFVTSGDAKVGDSILMTKTAGVEGTAVLARSGALRDKIPEATIRRARGFLSRISVVEEAVAAFETGAVHAMHDCTEGGVLGAAFEMSLASGLGFRLEEKLVPVAPETRAVCGALGLDPLKLIGSGSLMIAAPKGDEGRVADALRGIAGVTVVGRFVRGQNEFVRRSGKSARIRDAPVDELWKGLSPRS